MSIPQSLVSALAVFIIPVLAAPSARAQSAENVAVVINESSDESRRIGEYYAKTRALPPSNVLRIQTAISDSIERVEFVRTIERPLSVAIRRGGLQDRLLYLVLTKGVPLRISGTTGITGTAASVDSELTLLYRRLVGIPVAADGRIENPYYLGPGRIGEARRFTHREHDIYLVTRIDAFTVDQALALIDRAQAPATEGRIVLDQRGDIAGPGDQWMALAAKRLSGQGSNARVRLEMTTKPARGEPGVLGYYSWGASDPENQVRTIGMRFAPGAIAANLASFDARTFRQPPDDWRPTAAPDKSAWFEGSADALIGDLIRDGVTGVSGQVGEAYAFGAVRPEILFPAYLAGFNLAEAFYLATPVLSWQTIVIGDPLCAPFGKAALSREQLEEPVDPGTGYPGLYSKRRIAEVLAANKDVPAAAAVPIMRAQALLDRDDRAGAKKALEEAVALAPKSAGRLADLAQLQEENGEYDAAISTYRRVLELQPNNVVVLNNIAYALAIRRNAPADALPFAERAAQLLPRSGTILDTLAWIQHLLGNNELAVKLLDQAIGLEPAQPEIRLHAAFVHLSLSNSARAEAELKEAVRLEPKLEGRDDVQRMRRQLSR